MALVLLTYFNQGRDNVFHRVRQKGDRAGRARAVAERRQGSKR